MFGATAACSRLLGLSESSIEDAFGLTGSLAAGLRQFLIGGGDVKRIHGGWAAQSGYQAALWAAAGINGPDAILEVLTDSIARTSGTTCEPDRVLDRLGLELARFVGHGQALSMLPLSARNDRRGAYRRARDESRRHRARNRVDSTPRHRRRLRTRRRQAPPVEPYAAKFSAQYVLASALLDGVIGPQSFTDAAILRDDVHAYTDRVSFLAHDFGVAERSRIPAAWNCT